MIGRTLVCAAVVAAAVGGCGTAVEHSEPARARESWMEHGHPALRCAESLGVDPAAFEKLADDSLRRMQQAFQAATVTHVSLRGDYATVRVELSGLPGAADLENEGTGDYRISTMPRE